MTLRSCDEPVGRQDCETRRWQAMPTHDQRWKLPLLFQRFSIRGLCTAPFHFFPLLPWKKVNRQKRRTESTKTYISHCVDAVFHAKLAESR